MLNFGAETALKLIKEHKNMGRSEKFRMPLDVYVDRYVHLFLNQMSLLIDEPWFYLVQLVYRFFLRTMGRFPPKEVADDIIRKINQILQQGARNYAGNNLD